MLLMVLVTDCTHLYIESWLVGSTIVIDTYGDWANMASADTFDKTVDVLIVLLFDFWDFILGKPTQFGTQSPFYLAWL